MNAHVQADALKVDTTAPIPAPKPRSRRKQLFLAFAGVPRSPRWA